MCSFSSSSFPFFQSCPNTRAVFGGIRTLFFLSARARFLFLGELGRAPPVVDLRSGALCRRACSPGLRRAGIMSGELASLSSVTLELDKVAPFLIKLFEIVSSPASDYLICWSEMGDSFRIIDRTKFAQVRPSRTCHSHPRLARPARRRRTHSLTPGVPRSFNRRRTCYRCTSSMTTSGLSFGS